jgi:hypothetical protein
MNKGQILKTGKPKELISELEHKIWSKSIENDDLENYQSKYQIISKQLIERVLHITIFSETNPEGFDPVTPLLEHVYFNTLV